MLKMQPSQRHSHQKATTAATAALLFLLPSLLSSFIALLLLPTSTTAFVTSSSSSSRRLLTTSPPLSSSSSLLQNAYINESFPLVNNGQSQSPPPPQQLQRKGRPPKIHPESGGRITLVGSGPGSPELLTLAAHKLITNPSNLLIVDRLVSNEILSVMDDAGVQYKIANKTPGCQMAAQDEIFEWCKEGLRQGQHVVRLKIGDPFVFGRGGEEVLEFREFGVEPTVIPGVSAAFSAPLLASIPVTHRGISNQVVMCTGYGKNNTSPDLIQYHPEQTVVFLMAVGRLRELCNNLITKANYPPTTPVGIVERAGCPEQRTVVGTMENIANLADKYKVKPPSTIVVGEVVNVLLTEDDFVWEDVVNGVVASGSSEVVERVGGRGGGERLDDEEKEEMGMMMRKGYHGLVQSIYSS